MSEVTGAGLKKRIVRIMTGAVLGRQDFLRKLLLGAVGFAGLFIPVLSGMGHASQSKTEAQAETPDFKAFVYDVASIKPNKSGDNKVMMRTTPDGLRVTGANVIMLIMNAYQVNPNQISGAPSWLSSERYDIEAKMDTATAEELRKLNEGQSTPARQHLLQALLADRFTLQVHHEIKDLPIYALVVAKNGPQLQETKPGDTYPNGIKGPDGKSGGPRMTLRRGELTAQGIPIALFVRNLSLHLGRTVVDKTSLTGKYDFTLKWTPDESPERLSLSRSEPGEADSAVSSADSGPSIFTALQEQLGLKLESQKGPVEILVIDHVEKPSEN